MLKYTKSAAAVAAAASVMFGAGAAQAATATADATAEIIAPVELTKTSDLAFATIITGSSADTVVVSTSGARTCGSNLTCSGTTTAAGFSIVGTTGETVDIVVDNQVVLTNAGGNTMTASLNPSATAHTLTGVAANDVLNVGGTLGVGANQADGSYSGTFNVTVSYQ